jgi:hypothetical protein
VKTTIEIPDVLLQEARELAAQQRTTLRELVVEGLRRLMQARKHRGGFKLRRASFRGQGLQPQADGSGERLRNWSYEGRGA